MKTNQENAKGGGGSIGGMKRIFTMIADQFYRSFKPPNRLRTLAIVTGGASALFVAYSAYKHQNDLVREFVMPAARLLPAETAHNMAVWACKNKIYPITEYSDDLNLHTKFFGRTITNPIGIAAGFDKNGEAIVGLHEMGFGFIEVGTVTPLPQKGNPAPRVFRLESDRAIINRYGFNNEGHHKVLARLNRVKRDDSNDILVGVNLGRNRRTKSSVHDYVRGVETFGSVADYLVINVSSPNTKGLRDMQNKDRLEYLLTCVNEAREHLVGQHKKVPIFLKLSPDLEMKDIKDIVNVVLASKSRVDGLIVSNTTVTRPESLTEKKETTAQEGGLSGAPLRERSTQMIAEVYKLTKGRIPIIGVGGISTGEDAFEKIEAGASYVQFYTALVYEGPGVVERIKVDLSRIIKAKGYSNVQQAVGTNYQKYLQK